MTPFDPAQEAAAPVFSEGEVSFNTLFSDAACGLPETLTSLQRDLDLLESISKGEADVQTFDYEGRKYRQEEASLLLPPLRQEVEEARQRLEAQDRRVFRFFYAQALAQGQAEELVAEYGQMFAVARQTEKDVQTYHNLAEELNPLYTDELQLEQVKRILSNVKRKESLLRKRLQGLLQDETSRPYVEEAQRARLEDYLAEERKYFVKDTFDNEALALLQEALALLVNISVDQNFRTKKEFLERQLRLLRPEPKVAVGEEHPAS